MKEMKKPIKHLENIYHYKNKISFWFTDYDKLGLESPEGRRVFLAICRFLKKRGFNVMVNEHVFKHYRCLSKNNRFAFKNGVVALIELSGRHLEIEFGNQLNLVDNGQMFWSNPNDDRYCPLSYLQEKSVELELKRLLDFSKKYEATIVNRNIIIEPAEFIINKLRQNRHIHGDVKFLDDIKKSITPDSYDYKHNSNDANNKKIVCGEIKYFYCYRTKRLSCGRVWHNINNMWWVIAGGSLWNVADFNLFDYSTNLPKRKPVGVESIKRLLKHLSEKHDYAKCLGIKNQHKSILSQVA